MDPNLKDSDLRGHVSQANFSEIHCPGLRLHPIYPAGPILKHPKTKAAKRNIGGHDVCTQIAGEAKCGADEGADEGVHG
eukprot:3833804-Rhodomonas_salina.1